MKKPKSKPDILFQKALKAHQTGNTRQAQSWYQEIIKLDPSYSDAYHLLGVIQSQQSRDDEAIKNIEHAIELSACELYFNSLGAVYQKQGQIQKALFFLNKALERNDQYIDACNNLGQTLLIAGECIDAIHIYKKIISFDNKTPQLYSNYLTCWNYLPSVCHEEIYQAHCNFNSLFQSIPLFNKHRSHRPPKKKLRIGYVSPDFCRGSVGFFIEPILRHHDHKKFEIFCYANINQPDKVTHRMQENVTHWIDTNILSDDQMAAKIFQDEIDILVDICGHFSGNRLPVFARQPAPVQVTYLGYPNTTGLSSIQYRLTDAIADPDNADAYHCEKLIRVESPFLCYQPVENSPDISPLPAESNGYITLGSLNNLAKINDHIIDIWANILRQLPYSKLLLKARPFNDQYIRKQYLNKFHKYGINPDRLIFRGHQESIKSHLKTYHEIDLALDPFPYHGTTTTCDAIWMGVPVISLYGNIHAARVGATILSSLGMEDFIAQSVSDYIEKAVKICLNKRLLKTIRRQLRRLMQSSPLMDPGALTENIESLYKKMWTGDIL
jgi:predicted O-linked N-acetylglucosamine transferase (SPINDLY family)